VAGTGNGLACRARIAVGRCSQLRRNRRGAGDQ